METPNPILPENFRRLLEIQMNESMRLYWEENLNQWREDIWLKSRYDVIVCMMVFG